MRRFEPGNSEVLESIDTVAALPLETLHVHGCSSIMDLAVVHELRLLLTGLLSDLPQEPAPTQRHVLARTLGRRLVHPNIRQVEDSGWDRGDGSPFMVQEMLRGESWILRRQPPDLRSVAPAWPKRLARLAQDMLTKDPRGRPDPMGYILEELLRS